MTVSIKYFILIIFLHSCAGLLTAQSDSTAIIKISVIIQADLVLEVKVKETVAIGYAYCFRGTVLSVNRGTLKDSSLFITVLAGDKENYKILSSGNENTVYKMYCMHIKDNVEYNMTYITGFVDSKKTSWRIVYIIDNSKDN